MELGTIKRFLIGEPISNENAHHERIPKWKALAVLSSDALSSVAYATEEIIIPLAGFSTAAMAWSMPIALAIGILLIILTVSYRQTIDSYPSGGGAYTVTSENLGTNMGLIAAASLLIDYTLTVSVSVAAGIENIASAFPLLNDHKEVACSLIILVIMVLNLRGIRESANIFTLPTYLFIVALAAMLVFGAIKIFTHPELAVNPVLHEAYPLVPLMLVLRAFSSGCSALTGVEAITNGIPVFREPKQKNAKITMAWMSFILGVLFLGITLLAHRLGIVPKEGETAVSLLSHSIFGETWFYYLIQISVALILFLAANTAYADFPRLSSLLAKDRFLPRQLASIGDRLVFSNGIMGLSFFAIFLVILFKGTTHYLIPLYAIGVFLSFTLSQMGMIIHHIRTRHPGWRKSIVINALGSLTTAIVLLVFVVTKFMDGAWMVIILIPVLVVFFKQIKVHYVSVAEQLSYPPGTKPAPLKKQLHTVIVPVSGIHPGVIATLEYALSTSNDVRPVYVETDPEATKRMQASWTAHVNGIELIILHSPYRSVITPILEYIEKIQQQTKDEMLTVLIPEFVTAKWYHQFLHNQTAFLLRTAIRLKRGRVVASVRYYLK